MTYPTKYSRQFDFQSYQNANPTRPLPGDKVNADLNLAELSIDEIVEFLKTSLRSDGAIANGAVGYDQLSTALQSAGLAPLSAWAASTGYLVSQIVVQNGALYKCGEAHTSSSVFTNDLAAAYWTLLAELPSGEDGISPWLPVAAWLTATSYVVGPPASVVTYSGETYACLVTHTSGTFATDLAASKWIKIAAKGADGLGTGDVSAAANFGTDNVLVKSDGTTKGVQATGISIADTTNNISGTGAIVPASNDGGALGSASVSYSDLFLASGGVVNWANGDVTITHSANLLAFGGASSGYSFDAAVLPSSNDGAALGASGTAWSDAFFASGAVLNFNAGNYTITHSAGLLTFSGALAVTSIELGHASDTTMARVSAGVVSIEGNNILTTATGLSQGKHTIALPAGAWRAKASGGATSSSYQDIAVFSFNGTSATRVRTAIPMPKSWNESTITFKVFGVVDTGGSSGNVAVWKMAAKAFSHDDVAWTTTDLSTGAQAANMSWTANDDVLISAESSALTIDGTPAEGDIVIFELWRDPADASDNNTADFLMASVHIYITNNAANDT